MSHKNSLLFIGGVDKGHTPTNGETMKNQLYLDRFEEFFDIIHVIDTHNWKHRPWVFLQIPLYVLSFPHAKIFLSINRGLSLCRLLYYIGQSKRTYCSVVGGNLLEVTRKKTKLPSFDSEFKGHIRPRKKNGGNPEKPISHSKCRLCPER